MAQPCAPCERCEQYDQAAATCEASALEDHKECGDEGQVYWHDSCGVRGQLAESCAAPQSACFDGACACPAGRSGPECLDCEGGRYDSVQKLCWLQPAVSPTQHCIESQDYCAALDQAGHTDWRIPTKAEFMELLGGCDSAVQSLYSNGYCDSCAQSDRCTDLLGADSGIYWTFTTGGVSDMELAVNFGTGFFFGDGCHISSHQTRCVRSVE